MFQIYQNKRYTCFMYLTKAENFMNPAYNAIAYESPVGYCNTKAGLKSLNRKFFRRY